MDFISSAFVLLSLVLITNFPSSSESHTVSCTNENCTYDSNDTRAYCICKGLCQFPNFPPSVLYIDFNHNYLEGITNESSIPEHVEYLDLSYNRLHYIEAGAIYKLRNLKYLNLSYNMELYFDVLSNITIELQYTSIKVLLLNALYCENGKGITLKYKDFEFLSNTSLEELGMSSNRIEEMEDCVLWSLPTTITKLDLSNNRIIFGFYLLEFFHLTNVKIVNVSYMSSINSPTRFVLTNCREKHRKTSNYINCPTKQYGITHTNKSAYTKDREFSHPPRHGHPRVTLYFQETIEEWDVSNCFIHYDPDMQDLLFVYPNLKRYHAKGNFMTTMNGTSMISNATEFADLSNNYCSYISSSYFVNGISLRELNLNNNYLGKLLQADSSENVFKPLVNLVNLDLSNNFIFNLSFRALSPLVFIEILNLSHNNLFTLSLPLVKMKNLKSLDLSDNRIRFLDKKVMDDFDEISMIHSISLNLSKNLFQCSCETKSFLKWIRDHAAKKSIMFTDFPSYSCTYTNLTIVSFIHIGKILDDLDLHCSSNIGLIVSSVTVMVIFMTVLLSAILYRYRWKIRYLYYTTKRAFDVRRSQEKDLFKYDCFISFADEDKVFALSEILLDLEENDAAKVCCHTRDFIPGRPIADNIAAAVHESRFTVCVISKDYLNSYWCMYEFNIAKMEMEYARGGKNNIILLMMNDISTRSIPLNILHHLEKESYLEIPSTTDIGLKVQFLERLKSSIFSHV